MRGIIGPYAGKRMMMMMNPARKTQAFTINELLLVAVVFFAMAAVLAPFVQMTHRRSRTINCARNLKTINLALHRYALDHKECFPDTLGQLYPEYIKNEAVFDCPAASGRGSAANPDYNYLTGLDASCGPSTVVVYDKKESHQGRGRNILRLNGMVEWIGAGGK